MTRLSDALERAQAHQGGTPVVPEPSEPIGDVPADWHFDETGQGAAAPELQESLFPVEDERSRSVFDAPSIMDAPDVPPAAARLSSEPSSELFADFAAPDGAAPDADVTAPPAGEVTAASASYAADRNAKLVLGGQHDNLLVEQFRRLAAVLHHAQQQRQARTVMIASAVPAEGKSLTATNLALTLSGSYEKRVLLIDADLRRPSLHAVLDVPNTEGLTTILNDPRQTRLPIVMVQDNLWLLPAGRPDPNPTSLLTSPAMRQLLADAATQFDWVIIDTPPVGLMPDANLLAAMVDAAFVVVHAGRTPFPLVRKAVEAIGLERVLGVVLNRAARSAASAAYNYGYYDYYSDPARQTSGPKQLALG
jgi:capsular exopolysaccharide synthesis family protein